MSPSLTPEEYEDRADALGSAITPHSPGPWSYSKCGSGFRAPDEGDFQICAANMICPGTVWAGAGFDAEGEANARLIAAAPDLLKALKQAAYALSAYSSESSMSQRIRAAIAKAEGVS